MIDVVAQLILHLMDLSILPALSKLFVCDAAFCTLHSKSFITSYAMIENTLGDVMKDNLHPIYFHASDCNNKMMPFFGMFYCTLRDRCSFICMKRQIQSRIYTLQMVKNSNMVPDIVLYRIWIGNQSIHVNNDEI
jgi:hypothetical protein